MKRLLSVLAALTALFGACGGPSSATFTLRADLSQIPEGADPAQVMRDVKETLEVRAIAYQASFIDVDIVGEDTLTVHIRGVPPQTAESLLTERAEFEIMAPVIDEAGNVACRTLDHQLFAVPPQQVQPDEASRHPARCFSLDLLGFVEWQPITVLTEDGERVPFDAQFVSPAGWQIADSGLSIQLTPEGALYFEDLSTNLTGYPLGLFVDGELAAAAYIRRPITNGRPIISGFPPEEARLRAAQFNGGPLPVPLTVVE
jgi:preprotein translocase subunit SecD